jgi:predicted aspartyl protease
VLKNPLLFIYKTVVCNDAKTKIMSSKLFLINLVIICLFSCQKKESFETVSFEYIKNQIVVSTYIGDNGPLNFLVDTGVDPSAIDFETAKQLKLPINTDQSGNAEGRGNDEVVVFPTTIENLFLNNKNYGAIEAVTLNLEKLGAPLGIKLHGILGYSFLKDKIIRINYEDRILQIFKSKEDLQAQISQNAYISEFEIDGEDMIPILTSFYINGKQFKGSLDTGSSLNVQVYMHHRENFGIPLDTLEHSQIIGAQGKKKIYNSTMNDFSIGEYKFENEPISVSTIKNEEQLRMGNVGNKFLDNFVVTFDYINKNIVLERN